MHVESVQMFKNFLDQVQEIILGLTTVKERAKSNPKCNNNYTLKIGSEWKDQFLRWNLGWQRQTLAIKSWLVRW